MSELKVFVARKIDDGSCDPVPCIEVYLKSEADKVIAEMKKACNSKDDWCLHTLKENRHHKYKRCIYKAEMCQARYDAEDAKVNGRGASWEYTSDEMKYWERWKKRWLELAEQFKEANNA